MALGGFAVKTRACRVNWEGEYGGSAPATRTRDDLSARRPGKNGVRPNNGMQHDKRSQLA